MKIYCSICGKLLLAIYPPECDKCKPAKIRKGAVIIGKCQECCKCQEQGEIPEFFKDIFKK